MPKQKNARKKPAKRIPKTKSPKDNGENGRDSKGKFTKGNKGGPGNPYAKKTSELRKKFYECITPEDMEEVVAALLRKAKRGDVHAIKELLLRVLGQPQEIKEDDPKEERHGYFLQVEGGSLFIPDGMSISDAYRDHVSSKRSKKAG